MISQVPEMLLTEKCALDSVFLNGSKRVNIIKIWWYSNSIIFKYKMYKYNIYISHINGVGACVSNDRERKRLTLNLIIISASNTAAYSNTLFSTYWSN